MKIYGTKLCICLLYSIIFSHEPAMADSGLPSAGSQKMRKSGFHPLKAVNSTVHEFAISTTIHGIAYVFDRAIKTIDHVLWSLVVCFGAGVAVYMSLDAWNTWKDAPVLTSVSSTGLPLRKIDFPAITICSQGLIKVSFSGLLLNKINSFLRNFKDKTISKLSFFKFSTSSLPGC